MTEVRPDPLLEGLFFTARSHSINETEPTPVPEEDETKQSDEVSLKAPKQVFYGFVCLRLLYLFCSPQSCEIMMWTVTLFYKGKLKIPGLYE